MKAKDVDDLNDNWQKNVPCLHAYVCINWRLYVHQYNRMTIMVNSLITRRSNCRVDLSNGSRSNVNMPMKRPYATLYSLAIATFTLSDTVCEILMVVLSMTFTLSFIIEQC